MMMMKALNSYIFEIAHFERVYPSPKSCIHHQNPVTKLTGDGDGWPSVDCHLTVWMCFESSGVPNGGNCSSLEDLCVAGATCVNDTCVCADNTVAISSGFVCCELSFSCLTFASSVNYSLTLSVDNVVVWLSCFARASLHFLGCCYCCLFVCFLVLQHCL